MDEPVVFVGISAVSLIILFAKVSATNRFPLLLSYIIAVGPARHMKRSGRITRYSSKSTKLRNSYK